MAGRPLGGVMVFSRLIVLFAPLQLAVKCVGGGYMEEDRSQLILPINNDLCSQVLALQCLHDVMCLINKGYRLFDPTCIITETRAG